MLYPKIGIRPVIDGRWGGVREKPGKTQTMRMAENAAKLISENLKYPDGTPVQCVIGCTTIGGGAEAARVAEQFSTQNVTATLSVTPLLVLRYRNVRYGSQHHQGSLGLQWHRAPRRGVSGCGSGSTRPARSACFLHLRP